MTNLQSLEVKNAEYDLKNGFFWIELENGKSLQCCLHDSSTEDEIVINESDCGHDWGICEEANEWAVKEEIADWWDVNQFLMDEAERIGIRIICE